MALIDCLREKVAQAICLVSSGPFELMPPDGKEEFRREADAAIEIILAEYREPQTDELAKWLHEELGDLEKMPGALWPLHETDEGYRGDPASPPLVTKDVVEHHRDAARRLLAAFSFRLLPPSARADAAACMWDMVDKARGMGRGWWAEAQLRQIDLIIAAWRERDAARAEALHWRKMTGKHIRRVLAGVASVPLEKLTPDFEFDSLERIEVAMALEDEFDCPDIGDDAASLVTVAQWLHAMAAHLAPKGGA